MKHCQINILILETIVKHYQINTIILKNNYETLSDKHNNIKK